MPTEDQVLCLMHMIITQAAHNSYPWFLTKGLHAQKHTSLLLFVYTPTT